jgi:4-diphosphocytidyl-2C-methyl-D-erythritol kinase
VFETTGCIGHQMSGSGSSYFGLCWHAGQARRIAGRLRGMNLGAVMVAETVSAFFREPAKASQQV